MKMMHGPIHVKLISYYVSGTGSVSVLRLTIGQDTLCWTKPAKLTDPIFSLRMGTKTQYFIHTYFSIV